MTGHIPNNKPAPGRSQLRDASGETVTLVGQPPGLHRVLFELANPVHQVITSQTVHFTVPG